MAHHNKFDFFQIKNLILTTSFTVWLSAIISGFSGFFTPANAASVIKFFEGDRSDTTILKLFIEYDDVFTFSIPTAIPPNPIRPGVGVQCSIADTTGPYVDRDCYVNTDGLGPGTSGQTALAPWMNIPAFTGNPIRSITGTITDPDGDIYNVVGYAKIGSFEGGVTDTLLNPSNPPRPPLIPHYISDNLINPDILFSGKDSVTLGKGLSQGGFVILTDSPDYQYHLFSDPNTGELAGCGSGTCLQVRALPTPLPIFGAAAAFGSIRKLRKISALLNSDLKS